MHTTGTHVPPDFPPAISCRCVGGGSCKMLISNSEKNPGRRYYKCHSCGFFKWCDELTVEQITRTPPVSGNPMCPCGSGPCKRLKETSGPNAGRSYFVCGIKKGFGACAFFQWVDAQIPPEPEEGFHNSTSPSSGVLDSVAEDEQNCREETNVISEYGKNSSPENGVGENISPASGLTLLAPPSEENGVGQVTDGSRNVLSLVSVAVNGFPVEKEPNPLESRSNGLEIVPNVSPSAAVAMNQDMVHFETEEEVLNSLCLEGTEPEEPVEEASRGDELTNGGALSDNNSRESDASDLDEAMTVLPSILHEYETTSNEAVEHQTGYHGETEHSFANSTPLLNLFEQYRLEKFRFDSVSMRCAEAFSAFVDSYKRQNSLHERAHRLRKQLIETEKQIACCEAKTLEVAASVEEASGEMNESQKRMQETAEKLAKEMEVFKQRYVTVQKRKRIRVVDVST